jgi:hypothetical protein
MVAPGKFISMATAISASFPLLSVRVILRLRIA